MIICILVVIQWKEIFSYVSMKRGDFSSKMIIGYVSIPQKSTNLILHLLLSHP